MDEQTLQAQLGLPQNAETNESETESESNPEDSEEPEEKTEPEEKVKRPAWRKWAFVIVIAIIIIGLGIYFLM